MDRIIALSDLNPDYTNLDGALKNLTELAARVTGTPISMVNLIDNYTTWTVSGVGFDVQQTPRENSVCQYTILEAEYYGISDLSADPIFKDADFVTGDPHFRFYFGVPLITKGCNLGALCVLDKRARDLPAEKVELLKIIAAEVVNRLHTIRHIGSLQKKVVEVEQAQNKVLHDIRGPIAGIMGLADIISRQGHNNNLNEVLEFNGMMVKACKSVLDLADDILTEKKTAQTNSKHFTTLSGFKQRLEQLYAPQARSKDITFTVSISNSQSDITFPQGKLIQIAGNIISNAIKFTPGYGKVAVTLSMQSSQTENVLEVVVADTGRGIDKEQIEMLLADNTESTDGTGGEKGYGFGLALVRHLVKELGGAFSINSEKGVGSEFKVAIPFKINIPL